jgi:hypothetical protein
MKHYLMVAVLVAATTPVLAQEVPAVVEVPKVADATLRFSSQGGAMEVMFRTTAAPTPCDGLKRAAGVYNVALLEQNLPWLMAKLMEKSLGAMGSYPTAEVKAAGAAPLQIMGSAHWSEANQPKSCGPITQQFTPLAGHHYAVSFNFVGRGCNQTVVDDTDANDVQQVTLAPLQCELTGFSVLTRQ